MIMDGIVSLDFSYQLYDIYVWRRYFNEKLFCLKSVFICEILLKTLNINQNAEKFCVWPFAIDFSFT